MKVGDWKPIGQLLSHVQEIYTTIREAFAETGAGAEILPWLVSNGKESFVRVLKTLGAEFVATQRIRLTDDKNVIYVNLDAPPKIPFAGAEVYSNTGGGWVKVEHRKAGLYVDGKKIVLHLDERQKDGKVIVGHRLRDALSGKIVEHPNILDALIELPHLAPEDWKRDELGRIRFIFFWAVIYRDSDGDLCVRCLYFRGDGWCSHYCRLDRGWDGRSPAALRAS